MKNGNKSGRSWVFGVLGMGIGFLAAQWLGGAGGLEGAGTGSDLPERQMDVAVQQNDSSIVILGQATDDKGYKVKQFTGPEAAAMLARYKNSDCAWQVISDGNPEKVHGFFLSQEEVLNPLKDNVKNGEHKGYFVVPGKTEKGPNNLMFLAVYKEKAGDERLRILFPPTPTDDTYIYDQIEICPKHCPAIAATADYARLQDQSWGPY